MHIKRVKIKNIRSIRKLEMNFEQPAGWHVLIGDNGSGKTSILRAIAMGLLGRNEVAALRLNLCEYVHFDEKMGTVDLDTADEGSEFQNIINIQDADTILGAMLEGGRSNNWLRNYKEKWFSTAYGPYRRFAGGDKSWEKVYNSNRKLAAHLSLFGEDVALTEALEWLVELNYKKLEGNPDAALLLRNIKKFVNKGGLLPHETKVIEVSSNGVFFQDSFGHKINATEMSDGFRSILSMTFDILKNLVVTFGAEHVFDKVNQGEIYINIPGIILIDEIDAHLHPSWQTKIGFWFTKYFPNIQFIVTTHSPLICRACEKGTIWCLPSPSNEEDETVEITGVEKERLINGNILDAYGTELFGKEPVHSEKHDALKGKLGELNLLYAYGKINAEQEKERQKLQKILTTDDPTGY